MSIKTQENDKLFLNLVKSGMFSIFENGEVYNNIYDIFHVQNHTQRFIGSVHGKYHKYCCKDKRILTHRLVHLIYNGPIPLGYEVNHIDGNKLNNHYTNLEAITSSENQKHAFRTGLKHKKIGENNQKSKTTDKQVIDIREKYATGNYSHNQLAREYGLTKTGISYIINGKTYSHLPIQEYKKYHQKHKKQNENLNNRIIELSKQGLNPYQIAKQITEVSRSTILRIIKKYNGDVAYGKRGVL